MIRNQVLTWFDHSRTPSEDDLDSLYEFVQSEVGVRAVYDANAIPTLVKLLDKGQISLACRCVPILSKMTSYWPSWDAIVDARAVEPLIRLLSPEIGNDILEAVAHIITQSTQQLSWNANRIIPTDTLQQLVDLLRSGRLELKLTAAKVIRAVAKFYMIHTPLRKGSTVLDLGLCHLVVNCRDLTEKKLVVSAISALRNQQVISSFDSFDRRVKDVINTQIEPPLRDLLAHPSPKIVISACHVLGKSTVLNTAYRAIPYQLMRLLSHSDDEVFVEAIWTASDLVQNHSHHTRSEDAFSSAIPRLIRLLRHHEQQIVASALRSIADAPSEHIYAYLLEMVDQGGVRLLIDLLKSSNLAVAEAALLVVRKISDQYLSGTEYLVKHGVIQSLLHNLAFDSSPLFPETLDTLFQYIRNRRRLEDAHAIPFILQLLPTLHSPSIEKVLDQLYFHITDHFLLDVTFVGSKFPRQLLQIAWHILDSGGSLSRIVQIICSFVLIFKRSTDQFRTAGAESFFSDPRLLPAISEQDATGGSARRIQDALCRLRGNVQ